MQDRTAPEGTTAPEGASFHDAEKSPASPTPSSAVPASPTPSSAAPASSSAAPSSSGAPGAVPRRSRSRLSFFGSRPVSTTSPLLVPLLETFSPGRSKEDIALIVDESVPVADLQDAVVEGGGELLESVRLFDIYRGTQVPEGKKSVAFALRLRASDRTLTDADAATARDASVAVAAERFGAELRA